jgi:hypothetical protein
MTEKYHLIIEKGIDKDRKIFIEPNGSRLGRASNNDIALDDPALSRYNNRFFFKPSEGLWVSDLGSANTTLVNGKPVQEGRLQIGDRVLVGETTLCVISDNIDGGTGDIASTVDLGFKSKQGRSEKKKKSNIHILIIVACVFAVIALFGWGGKLIEDNAKSNSAVVPVVVDKTSKTLEIEYEKVIADKNNIFRYQLQLNANRILSVQIDDLINKRHVRKEGEVSQKYIDDLIRIFNDSGFYDLSDDYQGIQPDIYNLWDLSITIGKKAHHTIVLNRVEPEIFRTVRETLEEAGRNELGLWAIEFSADKLIDMANTASLLGKKLYDERDVKHGNVALSLKSFKEAEWYLETVEPKPEFYPEVIAYIRDCKDELDKRYENQNFLAERAIKLREWSDAANELRILCQIIPDRDDKRNKDARKKLLDIESRIKK